MLEKLLANIVKHKADISIEKILSGYSCGSELYKAKRTLEALAKIKSNSGTVNSSKVQLKKLLELAARAKACDFASVSTLSPSQRAEHFEALQAESIIVPPKVRAALVTQVAH